MLIVLEGACDGIGKTTQFNLLKKRLIEDGHEVITHHFPSYGTEQAKGVEDYLSGKYGAPTDLDPLFINGLYAHDRKVTWDTSLKEKYESGAIILLDRYTTSSLIYQASVIDNQKDKIDFIDEVCKIEYEKNGIARPDIVFFLTAPYDLVKEMREKRTTNEGIKCDIHETNDEYMRKVYENSQFVAKYLEFENITCNNGNQMRSIEEINEEMYNIIKKKLLKSKNLERKYNG